MTTFLFVRHGETDAIGKYLAGSMPGCHLNQEGMKQVKRLAALLAEMPIQAIYTSPLERAVETATELALAHELQPIHDGELGEMKFGDWQGKKFCELEEDGLWKAFNHVRSMVRPPNGELMVEVQARMVGVLGRIRKAHKDGVMAIVSHADPLRSLIAHIMGVSLDHLQRLRLDPASVSVVQFSGSQPEVVALNYTGSLAI